jgi:4-amino-4-deoxy-L-arabinose transferase-like glycosyltransferase
MANRTSHGIRIAEYWLLAAVLVVFACLSFFYTSSVPPFEGPDEPEHFAYILWVAEGRGFPPQGEAAWETPVRQESGQPPFYYWLASLPLRLVDVEAPTAEYRPNPHFPSSAPGHIPDNKNIAIHYPDDDTLQGGWLALRLARGVSILFGVLLIVSVYLLARELFPERRFLAVASAALTAVIPQVLFISNVASNDIPAAAMGTLTLWLMVQLLQRGPTFRDGFTLGLAFGLSALSKTGNLALALPVAAGFAWLFWQKNEVRPQLLKAAVAAVVAALLAGGWWYLRSWVLYGSPFGLDAHYLAPWALSAESAPLNPVAQWQEVFYSFWAAFGWGNIKFQALLYLPIVVLTLVAVLVPVFIIRKNWPG